MSPKLFTAPEGGVLRLGHWRRRVFDPACRAADLVDVTPPDLRHTAASLAIASGANVKAVQKMFGHASAAMTLDVYAGLLGDDLDAVALALDGLVPQMRPREASAGEGAGGVGGGRQCLTCPNAWWAPSGSNRRPAD
jgi:site-specific recombinase XerC